jgi:CheY-like chemotaxis protein
MIIEDDPDIRSALAQVLMAEGYEVHEAANGREGIEALQQESRPGLILLDLMMPVMNGWEFLQVRRQDAQAAAIPVVVVSAVGTPASNLAIAQFLPKPIDLDQLLEAVAEHGTWSHAA